MLEKERTIKITEKEAPYAPAEELGEWHLRRWTWHEKQTALDKATEIINEKTMMGILKMADYYAHMILICTEKSPVENLDLERLKKIDADVGDLLKSVVRELNGLTSGETAGFLGKSDSDEDIPG